MFYMNLPSQNLMISMNEDQVNFDKMKFLLPELDLFIILFDWNFEGGNFLPSL